ncbi:MAG: hypothetical protein M3Q55_15305 [Acidobacteriota bacterium]|nr:hypothetical protein [Acidobacteriota bacterium]
MLKPRMRGNPSRRDEVPNTFVPPGSAGLTGDPVDGAPLAGVKKGLTRADFRAEEFLKVIRQHGKYVIWRKALLCPCQVDDHPAINCEQCDGSGFFYIDAVRIQAHMVSFDAKTRLSEKIGIWLDGSCSVTVEPEYRLGFRDSLQMRDSVMVFDEVLTKGNRRGIRSKLPARRDSARYRIVELTRAVVKISGQMIPLIDGVHYVIDRGWIHWTLTGDELVATGSAVSVRYTFHPVFIIVSHPHATRDDVSGRKSTVDRAISLPVQGAAKLDFLLDINAPVTGTGDDDEDNPA